jgi:hypothetical protein
MGRQLENLKALAKIVKILNGTRKHYSSEEDQDVLDGLRGE